MLCSIKIVFKQNINFSPEFKVDPTYFRGKVTIQKVLGEDITGELEIFHVFFRNGAITTLHYHETDQVLIATKGKGIVGTINRKSTIEDFEIDDIRTVPMNDEGDIVHIPAFNIHFHGAIPKKDFSHIAIRQMHTFDSSTKKIRRAENKWENDLILENIGKPDFSLRDAIARKIEDKIKMAIQRDIGKANSS